MTAHAKRIAALLQRWDRVGLGIRCGYNPEQPTAIRHYLEAGRQVARARPADELALQHRMLTLLLQTAGDEALPWFWRAVCLEYTARPLARITSLLAPVDPAACRSVDALVEATRDRLAQANLSIEQPQPHQKESQDAPR